MNKFYTVVVVLSNILYLQHRNKISYWELLGEYFTYIIYKAESKLKISSSSWTIAIGWTNETVSRIDSELTDPQAPAWTSQRINPLNLNPPDCRPCMFWLARRECSQEFDLVRSVSLKVQLNLLWGEKINNVHHIHTDISLLYEMIYWAVEKGDLLLHTSSEQNLKFNPNQENR